MASLLLLYGSKSLLLSAITDQLTSMRHFVEGHTLTMSELSHVKERHDAALIFCDEDLEKNTEPLVFIKDYAAENDVPIFVVSDDEQMKTLLKTVPQGMITGTFTRPINVKNVVDTLDAFFKDEKRLAKKKILVVDDSGSMLRNIKGWLEEKYQVVLANSGAMAIKYLTLDKPDLVLLDYEMPIVDGKQVLEMIRGEVEFSDVPVIFLTGKSDKDTVVKVMGLKPEGYLLKSMPPMDIVKNVDDFFMRKKMAKAVEGAM